MLLQLTSFWGNDEGRKVTTAVAALQSMESKGESNDDKIAAVQLIKF